MEREYPFPSAKWDWGLEFWVPFMSGAIHELVVSRLILGSRLGRAGPVGLQYCLYVGFPCRESDFVYCKFILFTSIRIRNGVHYHFIMARSSDQPTKSATSTMSLDALPFASRCKSVEFEKIKSKEQQETAQSALKVIQDRSFLFWFKSIMSPPVKRGGSAVLPDNCGSNGTLTADVMQMRESQVVHGYRAPGQFHHPPQIEWVKNTLDGSILQDHKGYPLSVNRILATKPLRAEVSSRPGPGGKKLTYMSGEGVTRTLNEIFGYDGWNLDIVKTNREECVKDEQGRWHVAYTSHVRLTHNKSGAYKEDVGASDSIDRSMASAIGHALKGSITDALKRAARHFGEKLGNVLYQGNFTLNKAPLTLRDALDEYDKERETTKFGPSTKPKQGPVKSNESANNQNFASTSATVTPAIVQTRVALAKSDQPANAAASNGQHLLTGSKTPSNNHQLVASVSATPKVPSNHESEESLKSRLGPAPSFQLPPAYRPGFGSSDSKGILPCSSSNNNSEGLLPGGNSASHAMGPLPSSSYGSNRVIPSSNDNGKSIVLTVNTDSNDRRNLPSSISSKCILPVSMRPPLSAADRLSNGNMFSLGASSNSQNINQAAPATARGPGGTNLSTLRAFHGRDSLKENSRGPANPAQLNRASHGSSSNEPAVSRGPTMKRPAGENSGGGDSVMPYKKTNTNLNPYR
jgi:DNA recombination protein Rad52